MERVEHRLATRGVRPSYRQPYQLLGRLAGPQPRGVHAFHHHHRFRCFAATAQCGDERREALPRGRQPPLAHLVEQRLRFQPLQ
jgi:hypothetical protein